MHGDEYVVAGLCQFRCCFFFVCLVVCKWDASKLVLEMV